VSLSLRELLARSKRLEERRATALAIALEESRRSDQLARKNLEEVLRIAEAAREEARRSYSLDTQTRRMRLRIRGGARRDPP